MFGRSAARAILVAGLFLGGCLPPGQRYLKAVVDLDGKPVLETSFGVSDSLAPPDAWTRLEGQVFKTTSPRLPEFEGSSPVLLKGKLRLALTHSGDAFATADLGTLSLVPKDGGWTPAPGEVARTRGSVK